MDTNVQIMFPRNRKGIVLIWVVMLIPVILLFALIAVDFSYMYVAKGQLQNAADAAALAGAQRLIRDDAGAPTFADMTGARNRAKAFALANNAATQGVVIDKNSDITFGNWNVHYTVNGTPVNAIQVRAARDPSSPGGQVPIIFGKYFGRDRMSTVAVATAAIPARGTSVLSMCPDFCRGSISDNVLKNYTTASTPPILMDTTSSTASPNAYAWTSYDSNVSSTSAVRDLVCAQTAVSRASCNGQIYANMGALTSALCNLEAQMYNPYFDSDNKDYVAKGLNTTGWWIIVPITHSCPPGAQGNSWDPRAVDGYAKVHVLAICTTGCGSGQIQAPCSVYSAPAGVCDQIALKYGFDKNDLHNKIIIDKLWCVSCAQSGSFAGRRPVLVSE